jgi:caa(3)-type oxidase subunit IV
MSDEHTFSANKIFGLLILYTALEVAWGTAFDFPRWAIWSGLLIFAFMKGYLIFTWFMHMKFEQPILKFMIVPTIPLVAILIFANMPDTSFNKDMLYPIGHQLEVNLDDDGIHRSKTGKVTGMPDVTVQ